ncbi:MAG: type II secretion system protein [Candidatus Gracilibacteria bacterium]|nr:type II secretion system protein [Candidatus Gracilibacteria bacterium]
MMFFLKNNSPISKDRSGFTLVELVVATTILSIIMLSIFSIYFNIVDTNKKLELARVLQENSRNITENIAKDIREKGIDYGFYTSLTEELNYSGSGNTILAIKGPQFYCLMDSSNVCKSDCEGNRECFIGKSGGKRISDERVIINKLRFFISGTNDDVTNLSREGKVTLVFELGIMPGKGLNADLAKTTKLNIQTTISEKIYKK